MSSLIVIHDGNYSQHTTPPTGCSRGLEPRDFKAVPYGSLEFAQPFPDKLVVDRAEWKDRLHLQKKDRSRLIDARARGGPNGGIIPARDQNGKGYCWAHSTVSCALLLRAMMNEPYADLSAYHIAATIKNYRDEGGYNAQSVKFMAEHGCATSKTWPQQSMDRSLKNKPEVLEDAARFKLTGWFELEPRNVDHLVSAYLHGMAVVSDYNWWGHSVGGMALEEVDPKNPVESLIGWILNSWGQKWSQEGAGMLKGKKFLPDAAIALSSSYASAA